MKRVVTLAGVEMPSIIYGTAWKEKRTKDLVVQAVQAGFRGIDTACQPKHYNEAGVGEAIAELKRYGIERESLFIQTKFTPVSGQDPARMPYDPKVPLHEQVAQSFATSQKNLGSSYVDSLVLHSAIPNMKQLMEVWTAMERIYEQKGARQLGISNCYSTQQLQSLWANAKVKPAVVQNRFYRDTNYDAELRAFCDKHGVIYQSFWSLTANPDILSHRLIASLAEQYGKTPAQIWFRFLTQINIVPLTGTKSLEHMKQDLAIFEFELSKEQVQQVNALLD